MISRKKTGTGQAFVSGVLILSVSNVAVKIIGLLCKIPLLRYLGAEGMGYYNSAYEIYALLCVIATAGLPLALSMTVSEKNASGLEHENKRVYSTAFGIFSVLGLIGTAIMLFGASALSDLIGNPDSARCMIAIAPTLFFICVSSAVRGYFQGLGNMIPTAVSQILEALGKLILGVGFAMWALKRGESMPYVAAMAVFGLSLGTAASFIYLLIAKKRSDAKSHQDLANTDAETAKKSRRSIAAGLARIAIPVTVSSSVLSFTRVADTALILRRLRDTGYSLSEANRIFGSYTTLAVPLFSLPASLIAAVALSLVPSLVSAINSKDPRQQRSIISSSVKMTAFAAIPASIGLSLFARPILQMIFARSGDASAIDIAAPLLSVLGASVFLSCMMTTTNAVLQSYGLERKPMISMVAGAVVKVISAYLLMGIKPVNIYGAPISTFLCSLTVISINLYYLGKKTPWFECSGKGVVGMLGCSVLSAAISYAVYILLGANTVAAIVAMLIMVVVYLLLSLRFGGFEKHEIEMLPGSSKIYLLMNRRKQK